MRFFTVLLIIVGLSAFSQVVAAQDRGTVNLYPAEDEFGQFGPDKSTRVRSSKLVTPNGNFQVSYRYQPVASLLARIPENQQPTAIRFQDTEMKRIWWITTPSGEALTEKDVLGKTEYDRSFVDLTHRNGTTYLLTRSAIYSCSARGELQKVLSVGNELNLHGGLRFKVDASYTVHGKAFELMSLLSFTGAEWQIKPIKLKEGERRPNLLPTHWERSKDGALTIFGWDIIERNLIQKSSVTLD